MGVGQRERGAATRQVCSNLKRKTLRNSVKGTQERFVPFLQLFSKFEIIAREKVLKGRRLSSVQNSGAFGHGQERDLARAGRSREARGREVPWEAPGLGLNALDRGSASQCASHQSHVAQIITQMTAPWKS